MDRKLTTILAADVAGFSRLVGDNEETVLAALQSLRQEVIDPAIARHGGRVANTAGDSLLVEFASPVEATRCAVAIQTDMRAHNSDMPADRRIEFRMGLNLGDVLENDGDLLGDGVNVAARLENLAPPGGIVVGRSVRDLIRDKAGFELADLGEIRVKNIARPVRAFQILQDGERPVAPPPATRGRRGYFLTAVLAVVAVVAAGLFWQSQTPAFAPVDPAEMDLALPRNPSIAVLPFQMRGDAGERDWVADGVTDSIISTLSLAPDMVVIASSTMRGYKDRRTDAAQVARELGVQYVLSGSVLGVGDTYRVTAELADTLKGKQLWSLQEDASEEDLLSALDGISRKVFEEMSVSLTVGEGARSWIELAGGFENYVAVINGRAEFQKWSPEAHSKAERIWGKLLEDNPDQAFANYLMGYLYWQKVGMGLSTDPAADRAEANRLAWRALALKEFGEGYTLAAVLALEARNYDEAIALADKAVALAPGSSDANSIAGLVKATSGQTGEGLTLMELGMRLEPNYPEWLPAPVNFARAELGRYDEAKKLARDVLASDTRDVRAKPYAASMLTVLAVFAGDMDAARQHAKTLMRLFPQASAANARRIRAGYRNQEFVERYIAALVAAGIPED